MTKLETEILADLLAAKHICLVQMRDIGRRQLEVIDGGDMTSLLDLLSVKQRMLVQLQRIERTLEPFRSQDPEQRQWRTPQHRQACRGQIQQCEGLLAEIMSQEKVCESALRHRRDQAAVQLQDVQLAGRARGAYAAESQQPSSQLDLSSESR
jgi:hypothetical protein